MEPGQVADLLALKGDAIDNIPGAPGIGDKGAKDLLEQFGSVEAALDRAAEVKRQMYRKSLQKNRERILMSKQLATIECDVPVPFDARRVPCAGADLEALKPVFHELEFFSHLKELGPGEDSRPRDFARSGRCRRGARLIVASIPKDMPLSVAYSTGLERIGAVLAGRGGAGRSDMRCSRNCDRSSKILIVPKAAADLKSFTLQLLQPWSARRWFSGRYLALRIFCLRPIRASVRWRRWSSAGWICGRVRGRMSEPCFVMS